MVCCMRRWALVRLFVGRIGRQQPIHPHISAFQNWREQAGPAGPSRGAPDLTRKWVWRKDNLGPGGFVLSSSPHDLREKPACQSFLWGPFWRHPEWFETLTNPQQNTTNCVLDYHISVNDISTKLNPPEKLEFRRGRGTPPDGSDSRRSRRRNTQVLACPDPVRNVGSYITKAPSSRRLYGGTKNHARRFQGATPGLLPPSAVA